MTIKKRLFWSNILMILVPVLMASLIGLLCVGFMWLALVHGVGIGIHDEEDFGVACAAISEMAERESYEEGEEHVVLERLLDSSHMRLVVYRSRNVFSEEDAKKRKFLLGGEASSARMLYAHGEENAMDAALLDMAWQAGEETTVTQSGRGLYWHPFTLDGRAAVLCISGNYQGAHSYSDLKTWVVCSAVLILATILLTVFFTNRFLTRFVLRRIEEPLDLLSGGVHEIRDGNLTYRLVYGRSDEFAPVFEDFNEMAGRLQASVEEVLRQDRSRKELIAGISHDIRSPLTSIQAYVEGLLDGIARTPERQRTYLLTIKSKAESLSHILSQLFLFSKMELGDYPEHPLAIQLDEVVRENVLGLREELAEKGLSVSLSLAPACVWADPVQIQRIVSNILGNSIKYKKSAEGHVRVSLVRKGANCLLAFTDDGPGVAEEALESLFEVFYRSDPARSAPEKGSGLGLAIVKSAVSHMGGTVTARNVTGGGLCVEIMLPLCNRLSESANRKDFESLS